MGIEEEKKRKQEEEKKKGKAEKINPWTKLPYSKVTTCLQALDLVDTVEKLCSLCQLCCKKRRVIKISREKTGGWFWHATRNKNCQWWAWENLFANYRRMPEGLWPENVAKAKNAKTTDEETKRKAEEEAKRKAEEKAKRKR